MIKAWHPGLPGWECPLRSLTGVPCPSCFLTRATSATFRGDLESAVSLHAFGPLVAVGLFAWSFWALRQRRLLPPSLQGRHLVLAAVALLAYWLARLTLQWGFGMQVFPAAG
ncbi:DUF2752 domain-containing protein [Synechococcus sp. RSCCF101]|uniref:DUF2752 domain-containing protein n=1 Tax=Synechococcus sp. RSCCF101 TaxID=2511069 RepID=UPI001CD9954F|nr:DUF2752 domain-containing protein [Synechococcus sp. RSCCF101]